MLDFPINSVKSRKGKGITLGKPQKSSFLVARPLRPYPLPPRADWTKRAIFFANKPVKKLRLCHPASLTRSYTLLII